MSIKEAMLKQVRVQEKKAKAKSQSVVENILSRLEFNIAKGRLSVPNVGKDEKAHAEVAKLLAKDGINTEFFTTDFKARSKKGKGFDCQIVNMRVSLK